MEQQRGAGDLREVRVMYQSPKLNAPVPTLPGTGLARCLELSGGNPKERGVCLASP